MIARILAATLLFSLASLTGGTPALAAQISVSGAGLPAAATIDSQQLAGLPAVEIATATPWTGKASFSGPYLTDVLALLKAEGGKVSLIAKDDYKVELSLTDIRRYRPIIATSMNGKPIPPRERGPFWLMFPFDDHPELQNDAWFFRAIWQIDRIRVEP
ncbi:molybdopterin-dependent oxidoreductase [Skermanella mucosa]|uniref:molybdopterin-dependent oxidoreductase n=1 Tax=Skermanella mucosa TaxID=1789672 RepID=UPI00192B8D0B|nr:molybdopterin-dependent oxidoreductase [Skermanella mucosa]UEM21872.1 molybdopterin-dependent oxidoreductase [Skermanella mucosa]